MFSDMENFLKIVLEDIRSEINYQGRKNK